jgi:hypothetical protein
MEVFVFIILAIITIVIIIVIIRAIIDVYWSKNNKERPGKPGETCNMTSDCSIGLTCDQSTCLVPITGSCVNVEDKCSQNGTCFKGMCIINTQIGNIPTQNISPTTRTAASPSIKNNKSLANTGDYNPNTFHSLISDDTRITVKGKNIVDASFDARSKTSPGVGFMWYLTTNKAENRTIVNVTDYNGNSISTSMAKDILGISCQSFGRVCYVLVKQNVEGKDNSTGNVNKPSKDKNITSLKSKFAMQKFTLTLNGDIKVEHPLLPKHDDTQKCINLGISDKGVIMIVTEDSNISFNINSVNEDVSSWYLSPRNNRDILYMSYINGVLFSFTQDNWYYGNTSGERVEGTYPVVVNNIVENKNYWSKPGLKLSDN